MSARKKKGIFGGLMSDTRVRFLKFFFFSRLSRWVFCYLDVSFFRKRRRNLCRLLHTKRFKGGTGYLIDTRKERCPYGRNTKPGIKKKNYNKNLVFFRVPKKSVIINVKVIKGSFFFLNNSTAIVGGESFFFFLFSRQQMRAWVLNVLPAGSSCQLWFGCLPSGTGECVKKLR